MDHRLVVISPEGKLAGQHLIEDDAEGPDVGPLVEIAAPGLLGRHIGHSPQCRLALGQRAPATELGQPEVHDLGLALLRNHDVGAFYVAVNDAFAMGLAQPGRNLRDDVQDLFSSKRPLFDPFPERLPFHVLHSDVGAVLAFPNFIDDADIRMGKGRGRLGLDEEPLLELGRVHQVRRQEFQSHAALELEVLGLVDDAHPAGPDLIDDLVLAGDEGAFRDDGKRSGECLSQGGLVRTRFS